MNHIQTEENLNLILFNLYQQQNEQIKFLPNCLHDLCEQC
jgi:hypothetical protein